MLHLVISFFSFCSSDSHLKWKTNILNSDSESGSEMLRACLVAAVAKKSFILRNYINWCGEWVLLKSFSAGASAIRQSQNHISSQFEFVNRKIRMTLQAGKWYSVDMNQNSWCMTNARTDDRSQLVLASCSSLFNSVLTVSHLSCLRCTSLFRGRVSPAISEIRPSLLDPCELSNLMDRSPIRKRH